MILSRLCSRLHDRSLNRTGRNMKLHQVTAVILLLLFTGCVTPHKESAPSKSFSSYSMEDQAIYMAVLDAMFTRWQHYGPWLTLKVRYFITLNNQDAPTDLLEALKHSGYEVYPGSLYKHGKGVNLSLETPKHTSISSASVYGGYLFGNLGGEWGPFILKCQKGNWNVVSWEPDMFSYLKIQELDKPAASNAGIASLLAVEHH